MKIKKTNQKSNREQLKDLAAPFISTQSTVRASESITPLETVAHVDLIVTNTSGDVLWMMGGDNAALPKALRLAHQIEEIPVTKKDSMMPFQDIYEVDRDFVLATCGTFTSWKWETIQNLSRNLPAGAKFTYLVTV